MDTETRQTEAHGYRSAARNAAVFQGVDHECDGRKCSQQINTDRHVKLGCGCTRWEGDRHDGTRIHLLTGGCGRHIPDATMGDYTP